jgi:hypothetical protein
MGVCVHVSIHLFWIPINRVYSIEHYVIYFVSNLQHVGGFLRVFRFPPPTKLPSRYEWNIVESGVKHHNPYPTLPFYLFVAYIIHKILKKIVNKMQYKLSLLITENK